MRLAVLASGSGTILEAILQADISVAMVLVDRPCRATEVAEQAGIPAETLARTSYGRDFDRVGYTTQVVDVLASHNIDVIAMAGYGTILAEPIHERWPLRILNTHPALLPAFPGWNAVDQAFGYGVKITGCTVHLATLEVDAGPILAQEPVPVIEGDTVGSLHERIKVVERELYPRTIQAFLDAGAVAPAAPELIAPALPAT